MLNFRKCDVRTRGSSAHWLHVGPRLSKDKHSKQDGHKREERTNNEREVITAIHRLDLYYALANQRAGSRRSDAHQNCKAERATHHKRGVYKSRCKPRFMRRCIVHRSKQDRIERDARTKTEQDHTWQYI